MPATYSNTIDSPDVAAALGTPAVADGDSLVFSRHNTQFTASENAYAAKNLAGVAFIGGFSGSNATPLKFGCSSGAGVVNYRCPAMKIRLSFGAAGYDTHSKVLCNPTGPGTLEYSGTGTITKAIVDSGTLSVIDDTVTVSAILGSGGAVVVAKKTGPAVVSVQACGTLKVFLERAVSGNVSIEPAAIVQTSHDACTIGGDMLIQGRFEHAGGNIAGSIDLRPGGVLDFSKLQKSITIGGAANKIWANARVIRPPSGITVTWTNAPELIGNADLIPAYA